MARRCSWRRGDVDSKLLPLESLSLNANSLVIDPHGGGLGDAAVDADFNRFSVGFKVLDADFNKVSLPQDFDFLGTAGNSYKTFAGVKLNPSGSLVFIPMETSFLSTAYVDIFDVHRGVLAMRVALPESIPDVINTLALDEGTETKRFVISKSGITIAQLYEAPLSLSTVSPTSGANGTQVTLRGSGFENGASVTFGTLVVDATFVDAETLSGNVSCLPRFPRGPLRITVTNPNGRSYSFWTPFCSPTSCKTQGFVAQKAELSSTPMSRGCLLRPTRPRFRSPSPGAPAKNRRREVLRLRGGGASLRNGTH